MPITVTLSPEIEKRLIAQVNERGVPLDVYVQEIIAREAGVSSTSFPASKVNNLSELLLNSAFSGADLNLERLHDYPRATEIE